MLDRGRKPSGIYRTKNYVTEVASRSQNISNYSQLHTYTRPSGRLFLVRCVK